MKIIHSKEEGFAARIEDLVTRRHKILSKLRDEAERLMASFRARGEDFLIESAQEFDGAELGVEDLFVDPDQIKNSHKLVSDELKEAIDQSLTRIERCQMELKPNAFQTQDEAGIYWGVEVRPIRRVGLYSPAKQLTALMISCVQSRIAGVEEIIFATPPQKALGAPFIDPGILYLAKVFGVNQILLAGGAPALAALAFGTASTLPVEKIIGPTGRLAMVAKQLLSGIVGIDAMTGPADVAFVCNSTSDYKSVAADIISLAEKNPEAEVFVLHPDDRWLNRLLEELINISQTIKNEKAKKIRDCLESNTHFFLVNDVDEAFKICNRLAPGVLCVPIRKAADHIDKVSSAGALLLGHFTPPAALDLVGGASGLVPTLGAAVFSSMSSPKTFVREFALIEIQKEALERLRGKSEALAQAENLHLFSQLFDSRLKS